MSEQPQYFVGQIENGYRWDGERWRSLLSDDQRTLILNNAVSENVHRGWRVESITPTMATLAWGQTKNTNHLLHLILTLITCGLWLFIWIPVSIGDSMHKVKRQTLQVAPDGTVVRT